MNLDIVKSKHSFQFQIANAIPNREIVKEGKDESIFPPPQSRVEFRPVMNIRLLPILQEQLDIAISQFGYSNIGGVFCGAEAYLQICWEIAGGVEGMNFPFVDAWNDLPIVISSNGQYGIVLKPSAALIQYEFEVREELFRQARTKESFGGIADAVLAAIKGEGGSSIGDDKQATPGCTCPRCVEIRNRRKKANTKH